jgi:hypothetical protein
MTKQPPPPPSLDPRPPLPVCVCGALVSDHLVTDAGRCYLIRNARTLKVAGARMLKDAFPGKGVG